MILLILYTKKPRLREVRKLAQRAIANNQWRWALNPGSSDSSTAVDNWWLMPEITTAANSMSNTILNTLLTHFISTITVKGVRILFVPT